MQQPHNPQPGTVVINGEISKWEKNEGMGFVEMQVRDTAITGPFIAQGVPPLVLRFAPELARQFPPEVVVEVTVRVVRP